MLWDFFIGCSIVIAFFALVGIIIGLWDLTGALIDKLLDKLGFEKNWCHTTRTNTRRPMSSELASFVFFILVIGLVFAVGSKIADQIDGHPNNEQYWEEMKNKCYAEGQTAAEHGLPCECCPYGYNKYKSSITPTTQFTAWMRGWTAKMIEQKGKVQ